MSRPTIETERLILRPPQAGDVDVWTPFYRAERSHFIRASEPTDANAWRAFSAVAGHWTLRGWGSFVFALKGTPDVALGMTGPWYPHGWPEHELGWSIWREDAEGEGYVSEAAVAARDHAFRELGWKTAVSYVDARNLRSVRVAERLGAVVDWEAKTPRGEQCVVFRHPTPEGAP